MTKSRLLAHDVRQMDLLEKIVIIGTGPVGSWLGHELLSVGKQIAFVDENPDAHEHRWTIEVDDITSTHAATVDRSLLAAARVIFVATRAHHLFAVWQDHLAVLPPAPQPPKPPKPQTIIFCCNGYVEPIINTWQATRPDIHFQIGIVTAGIAEKNGRNFLRTDRTGKCFYGPLSPNAGPNKYSPEFIYDPDIRERARKKWLFNTAANTLAGVLQLPRNDLMIHAYRNRLRELFDEAFDLGCELWDGWRQKTQESPGHRETLWLELCQLITDTGANENSLSRAARTGKGTGEAQFLGGVAFSHIGYPELKRMTRLLLT